ncbi:MAG: PIN domain nuclease [Caldilineaceae bacterium]|nr:PIN domain nuclease [Caldilineaceae bacterium]
MAIMVDTSVWIDFFRGNETAEVARLTQYINLNERIFTGDLILAELLQGVRPGRELQAVEASFQAFLVVDMVGEANARQSASFYRQLRRKGVTVRKTIDCLIATWCIQNAIPLLHADRDFAPFTTFGLVEA